MKTQNRLGAQLKEVIERTINNLTLCRAQPFDGNEQHFLLAALCVNEVAEMDERMQEFIVFHSSAARVEGFIRAISDSEFIREGGDPTGEFTRFKEAIPVVDAESAAEALADLILLGLERLKLLEVGPFYEDEEAILI